MPARNRPQCCVFPQSTGGTTANSANLGVRDQTSSSFSGGFATSGITGVNTFTLNVGEFYKFIATFQNSGSSSVFNVTATVENWGTSGTGFVSTVASGTMSSVAFTGNSALATDPTIYTGFRTIAGGGLACRVRLCRA